MILKKGGVVMQSNEAENIREINKKIEQNEKDILVLRTQYEEMKKTMSEIKDTIKNEFKEMKQNAKTQAKEQQEEYKSLLWKFIGAMGTAIILLAGILKG